jgi:SARP family transcriptional regulator, regulator of embCAB operon
LAAGGETRIQLCGRFVVRIAGQRVEHLLPGPQGRHLFAYLAAHRHRPPTRDELVDALWPDNPPSAPQVALSALLSKLRRAIGEDALVGTSQLSLLLAQDAFLDVEAVVEAIHRAESAVAAKDWHRAYGPSRLARYISERPFLRDCEAAWARERRRQLEDIQIRALECGARASVGIGGAELVLSEQVARRLVALAPYRETGHCLLMEILSSLGNVAEALLVFEQLRLRLRDDLGTVPGPQVIELHQRLLREGQPASTS